MTTPRFWKTSVIPGALVVHGLATECWWDFRVYERPFSNCSEHDDPCLEMRVKDRPNESTLNPDEAEVWISGHIKWDGCSEIRFEMTHVCGPDGWADVDATVRRLFEIAREEMSAGDGYVEF